jgi:hypothetical protein
MPLPLAGFCPARYSPPSVTVGLGV